MIPPIAVRADVPHDKTTLANAKHSAHALSQRIDTAVQLHYAGTTYLIQPHETYFPDVPLREPQWEAA